MMEHTSKNTLEDSGVNSLELRKLIDILTEEADILKRLHSILEEEQDALTGGDVERIRRSVEDQISLVKDISRLEDERRTLLPALGLSGEETDAANLDTVIQTAPDEEGIELRRIRSSLQEVLKALGMVNKRNGMLIRQSLSYIDKALRLVAGEDAASSVYTADGELKQVTGRIAVDGKV